MTKVEILSNQFPSTMEGLVNNALSEIEDKGGVIKDIKYTPVGATVDVMIVYECNANDQNKNDKNVVDVEKTSDIHKYSETYLTKMFSEARNLVLSTDLTGFRLVEAVTLPLRIMVDDASRSANSDLAYHAREFSKAHDQYQPDYFA